MSKYKKVNILLISFMVIVLLIPLTVMIGFRHAEGIIVSVKKSNSDTHIAKIEYQLDGGQHTITRTYSKLERTPQKGDKEVLFINPLLENTVHMTYDFILFLIIEILCGILLIVNIKFKILS